jgi:hypothetical protein
LVANQIASFRRRAGQLSQDMELYNVEVEMAKAKIVLKIRKAFFAGD